MWGKLLTDTYNKVRTKADEVRQQVSNTVQAQQATISKARDALFSLGLSSQNGRLLSRANAIEEAATAGLTAEELMHQLQKEASGVRTVDEVHDMLLLWRMLTLQSALHSAPRFASAEFLYLQQGDERLRASSRGADSQSLASQADAASCSPCVSSSPAEGRGGLQSAAETGAEDAIGCHGGDQAKADALRPCQEQESRLRRAESGGHAMSVAFPAPVAPSFGEELREESEKGEKAIYGDGVSFKEVLLRSNALERCLLAISRRSTLRNFFALHTEELLAARREAHRRYEARQEKSQAGGADASPSSSSTSSALASTLPGSPAEGSTLSAPSAPRTSPGASSAGKTTAEDPLLVSASSENKASTPLAVSGAEDAALSASSLASPSSAADAPVASAAPAPAMDAVLSLMSLCLPGSQDKHLELLHELLTAASAAAGAAAAASLGGALRLAVDARRERRSSCEDLRDEETAAEGMAPEKREAAGAEGAGEEGRGEGAKGGAEEDDAPAATAPALQTALVNEGLGVLEAILQIVSAWKRNWVLERKEDARRRLEAEARHLAAKIEDCDFSENDQEEDPLVTHNIRLLANAQLLDLQQRIILVKQKLLVEQTAETQRKMQLLGALKARREVLARGLEGGEDAAEELKKDVQLRMTEASEALVKEAAGLEERRTALSERLKKLREERMELERRLEDCLHTIATLESEQLSLQREEDGLHLDLLHVQKQYKEQMHLHHRQTQQQSLLRTSLEELGRTGDSLVTLFELDAEKKRDSTAQDVEKLKAALQTQVCRHFAFEKTRLQQHVQLLLQCMQTLDKLLGCRGEERTEGFSAAAQSLAKKDGLQESESLSERLEALDPDARAALLHTRKRFLRACRQLDQCFAETEQFVSFHKATLVDAIRQQQQTLRHRREGEEDEKNEAEGAQTLAPEGRAGLQGAGTNAAAADLDPLKDIAALYRQTKKQIALYLGRLSTASPPAVAAEAGVRPSPLPPPSPTVPPSQPSAAAATPRQAAALAAPSSPPSARPAPPPAAPVPSLPLSAAPQPQRLSPFAPASSGAPSAPVSSVLTAPAASPARPEASTGARHLPAFAAAGRAKEPAPSLARVLGFSSTPTSPSPPSEPRISAGDAGGAKADVHARMQPAAEGGGAQRDEKRLGSDFQIFDLKTPPLSPREAEGQVEKKGAANAWQDDVDLLADDKLDNWLMD
ncbi:hypothetical protein BESB_061690 [Besnoitia besnoiti]|uniref:Uncharacterized protein n=1 Tax=Besnoitia besnoiti TaxID=94643 RepID=A0A2A9MIR6_BESBE|nr:hypothetical protein BESB_061690 [Besnoitia besnoiti]PFH35282.1 hypothetical protein BESB_061690 [Besnoitia besnoiti]